MDLLLKIKHLIKCLQMSKKYGANHFLQMLADRGRSFGGFNCVNRVKDFARISLMSVFCSSRFYFMLKNILNKRFTAHFCYLQPFSEMCLQSSSSSSRSRRGP